MLRRFALPIGILFLLIGVAIYLSLYAKPGTEGKNPLVGKDHSKISKIFIQNPLAKVELEKNGEEWFMASPVKDWADQEVVAEILAGLERFTVGSLVSENSSKHPQFRIDDSLGAKIEVFEQGSGTPILAAVVGKEAAGTQSCYFRLVNSTPVYVAQGLADYQLRRDEKAYRESQVFRPIVSTSDGLKITGDKLNVDLVRSSETWAHRSNNIPMDAALFQELFNKVQYLSITDYGTGKEDESTLGFAKPHLVLTLDIKGTPHTLVIGNKTKLLFPQAPVTRYAKVTGREAILYLREDSIEDISSSTKFIPN